MATLIMTKQIGNGDFYRNDIISVDADMKDGTKQQIPNSEIDKLIIDEFKSKIDKITVHTSDGMMYRFVMDEWLVKEAD